MNTRFLIACLSAAFLVSIIPTTAPAAEGDPGSSGLAPREEWVAATVTAAVKDVDLENRRITLEGPLGNIATFDVDKRVKRLNEIKAGDQLKVDYFTYLGAEFREPTAAEKENPLVIIDAGGKAPPGVEPGAAGVEFVRAVVTIEALNRITETATIRGPRGNYVTLKVADPKRLEKVRIGDTVVVTYAEALAVSIEKVEEDND